MQPPLHVTQGELKTLPLPPHDVHHLLLDLDTPLSFRLRPEGQDPEQERLRSDTTGRVRDLTEAGGGEGPLGSTQTERRRHLPRCPVSQPPDPGEGVGPVFEDETGLRRCQAGDETQNVLRVPSEGGNLRWSLEGGYSCSRVVEGWGPERKTLTPGGLLRRS